MSNTDSRTPHTDALDTLGTIFSTTEKRDAIHLAVFPVEAGEVLMAGDYVKIGGDGKAYLAYRYGDALGIVDPFIADGWETERVPNPEGYTGRGIVKKGERFWLVVLPRTITSLRHVWEHPAFPASGETDVPPVVEDREASEKWLREWCEKADCPGYDAVMAVLLEGKWRDEDHPDDGYYPGGMRGEIEWGGIHFVGRDAHGDIPNEFWHHMRIAHGYTGPAYPHFSCSC